MPLTEVRYVSSGFLRAVGIALVRGRYFEGSEGSSTPEVMVNESFERSIAAQIPFSQQRIFIRGRLRRVVGVLADMRDLSSPEHPRPTVYVQFFDSPQDVGMIAVRTSIPPSTGMMAAIRGRIVAAGGNQPIYDVSSAEAIFERILKPAEFRAALLGVFASLGFLISFLGVYGVAAYAVARRQREIGIRKALGAMPQSIFTGYFVPGVRSALLGVCLGLGASLAMMRVASHLLFETSTGDALVVGAVVVLMGLSASLACLGPALGAMRSDPAALLRYE
jgi:ABC-type antimicrobial peptide transport system permease subunit